MNGKKPSKFQWTSFYRRIHKKDASKEVAKKRTKRIAKPLRLISGVTEQMLQDLRNKALSNRGAKLEAPKGEAANDKTRSKDSRKKSATTAKFDHKAATKAPQPLGKQQTRPAVMRGNPQQKR